MSDEPIEDFRRRTARNRRRRTGRRLVQALFEQADLVELRVLTVDNVLTSAGMARGSFYRHFATIDALLDHVGAAVGAQINSEMSARFDLVSDPAARIGLHVRYQVRRAMTDPTCAQLLLRLLARDGAVSEFARDHALADFRQAVRSGRFTVPTAEIASDLGHGMLTAILRRATVDGYAPQRLKTQVEVLLRAFGLDADDARLTAGVALPRPPGDSLRERVLELCGELETSVMGYAASEDR